jgi:peptidoglycan/LPS O-acetylase OafA/YrhL
VFDPASLPANLLMIHAWGFAPTAAFNHPSWSISAEWFAYLTFPAFAFVAARLSGRPWLAVAGAVALVFVLYAGFERAAGFSLTQATIAWGALRIVPCFALGCAVHLLWRSWRRPSLPAAWATALVFGAGLLGLVAAGAPDAALTASFGGLICGLAMIWRARDEQADDGLVMRGFAYLGEISYSTYMICIPWKLLFVNVAGRITGSGSDQMPIWLWLVFILSLIPLSAISHHLVERPARRWLKAHAPGRRMGATLQPVG